MLWEGRLFALLVKLLGVIEHLALGVRVEHDLLRRAVVEDAQGVIPRLDVLGTGVLVDVPRVAHALDGVLGKPDGVGHVLALRVAAGPHHAAGVIVFYVSTGGLLAVTYTDIVQMALLLLGIVVLAVPLVGAQLHKMGANLVTDLPASFFDLGAWGWPTILALGLSTIMSFFTSMDSYTRCIAARDAKTARTGTIYAAVLVFIIAGASTFLGMAGKLILPNLESSNNVIAALVVELFPHGLKGLVLIGVLSAIMSTADISVLTGSASLTKDIYQRYINPNVSEKTLLHVGLGASLLVGVLGAIFGWFTQDIMNILLITFTINSAGLFLPTIGAFFWKKSCSAGAFASMLSATVIAVVWFIGGKVSTLPLFSIDALWPSFGVSAILYVVICLTHRQTPAEQEKAEKFYAAK